MSRIAVVVLTHNRVGEVTRTLERLRALPERPGIIAVDNASTDGTPAVIGERFHDVDLVALRVNMGAAGRNVGVRRTEARYVAFCDDDAWWAPGALARAAALLDAHPRLALVTGRVLVGPQRRVDPTCDEMAASPLPRERGLPGTPVLGFLCAATMVRRSAFVAAGGFEPRFFLGGEERLLAIDLVTAGWALAYVDDVVVHHHPSARRDARGRRALLARNALWCAWLRRPLPAALRATGWALRAAVRDPEIARATMAALAGLGWALRRRRVVPSAVEAQLRCLERGATRPSGAPAGVGDAPGWAPPRSGAAAP